MAIERTHKLTAMLSEDEQRMLTENAERRGLTVSDWIRQAIRREHAPVQTRGSFLETRVTPRDLDRVVVRRERRPAKKQARKGGK
jgi:uncharacterized protein (DUF1778 family)